jgi:cytochrome b6-f complex iron-sulfur subunit
MSSTVSRRDFLKISWGAAGVAVALESGMIGFQFFAPRAVEGEFGGIFAVGNVEEFPAGSVTPVPAGRFYLVRMEDGGFLALYRKCTHLGCAVPWDQAEGRFVCPCHASSFAMEGDVLNPPAPRPLDRFAVSLTDGIVAVDTSRSIQRDRPSTDDLVYA